MNVSLRGGGREFKQAAMVDSGATALFMSKNYVVKEQLQTFQLCNAIDIFNIDGSCNTAGCIREYVRMLMTVDGYKHSVDFLVTDLGGENIILGLPWLRRVNPEINWEKGRLLVKQSKVTVEVLPDGEGRQIVATTEESCVVDSEEVAVERGRKGSGGGETSDRESARSPPEKSFSAEEAVDDREPPVEEGGVPVRIRANRTLRRKWLKQGVIQDLSEEVWIAAGFTYLQKLAEEAHKAKPERSFEEMVPEQYHKFSKVFSEAESQRLPEHKPWDHAIELVPGAPDTIRTKVYPMSPAEQEELDRFLDENLQKGYITPSKSPMASPFSLSRRKTVNFASYKTTAALTNLL